MLKAFAARRERWDLRCSLKLPLAVYIFPQKSHLCKRFLESENQQLLSNLYSSPVWLFPAVASDMIVVVAGSGKALTTHVTGVRFLTCNKGSGEQASNVLLQNFHIPVCKRMWYIRPTLVVRILLQCGHFSCWPPVYIGL